MSDGVCVGEVGMVGGVDRIDGVAVRLRCMQDG